MLQMYILRFLAEHWGWMLAIAIAVALLFVAMGTAFGLLVHNNWYNKGLLDDQKTAYARSFNLFKKYLDPSQGMLYMDLSVSEMFSNVFRLLGESGRVLSELVNHYNRAVLQSYRPALQGSGNSDVQDSINIWCHIHTNLFSIRQKFITECLREWGAATDWKFFAGEDGDNEFNDNIRKMLAWANQDDFDVSPLRIEGKEFNATAVQNCQQKFLAKKARLYYDMLVRNADHLSEDKMLRLKSFIEEAGGVVKSGIPDREYHELLNSFASKAKRAVVANA
jgi:hypothetical protein